MAGESLANLANRLQFTKLKPSKLVLTINNLLADLLIRQTFFCQMLETSQFAKLSHYTVASISTLNPLLYMHVYNIAFMICLICISMPHLIDFSPVTMKSNCLSLTASMLYQ